MLHGVVDKWMLREKSTAGGTSFFWKRMWSSIITHPTQTWQWSSQWCVLSLHISSHSWQRHHHPFLLLLQSRTKRFTKMMTWAVSKITKFLKAPEPATQNGRLQTGLVCVLCPLCMLCPRIKRPSATALTMSILLQTTATLSLVWRTAQTAGAREDIISNFVFVGLQLWVVAEIGLHPHLHVPMLSICMNYAEVILPSSLGFVAFWVGWIAGLASNQCTWQYTIIHMPIYAWLVTSVKSSHTCLVMWSTSASIQTWRQIPLKMSVLDLTVLAFHVEGSQPHFITGFMFSLCSRVWKETNTMHNRTHILTI